MTTEIDLSVLRQVLKTRTAEWIYKEFEEPLSGGGSLTKRGFVCSNCGHFRHKRLGTSKFCEDCGCLMKGGKEECD